MSPREKQELPDILATLDTVQEEIAANGFLRSPGRILPSAPVVEHLSAQGSLGELDGPQDRLKRPSS